MPAPAWWPAAAKPANGQHPGYWPPGYALGDCSSCGAVDGDQAGECKLGCMFTFRPSMKPTPPPVPEPPTPTDPPACGVFPSLSGKSTCTVGQVLNFSNVFGDSMVLQMLPARTAVYGYVGTSASKSATVVVTVASKLNPTSYTVPAVVDATTGTWKAFLKPTAAGGSYTITATCKTGCTGTIAIKDVTFGDVWYCSGQSNMALPVQYTYNRNASIAAIKRGKGPTLRITGLTGNMNKDQPWVTIEDAAGGLGNQTMPTYGQVDLDHFSSTCYYFGEALSTSLGSKTPIGLIHTAWGGSMIEQWLTNEDIAACHGASIADHNEALFDNAVKPYLGMSVKGWVYYQGENNCGGLHGNSGTAAQVCSWLGYADPMLTLCGPCADPMLTLCQPDPK